MVLVYLFVARQANRHRTSDGHTWGRLVVLVHLFLGRQADCDRTSDRHT